MFRTAVLRSARTVAVRAAPIRTTTRFAVLPSRTAAMRSLAPRLAPWNSVRCYAAAAGLNKTEVEERIMGLLQGFDKVNDSANIKPTAHFANDLGLDSLDTVEVVMAIEEEFSIEIPDKDADTIHSVEKAVEYILNQPDAH